jgi:cytochrome P450
MLLDARYEDNGEAMHEDQVIDEILIVLIAGHETTANALAWTLYLLANHPEELKKLQQATQGFSVDECVASDPLTAVVKESMRLYPPAWISDRVALSDDEYKDFTFPRGSIIVVFYYCLLFPGEVSSLCFIMDYIVMKNIGKMPHHLFQRDLKKRILIKKN